MIYADKFGNIITNIKRSDFKKFLGKKDFTAFLKRKKIKRFCSSYSSAKKNIPFFIEGSFGYLEISLKESSALKYFGIKTVRGTKILVKAL